MGQPNRSTTMVNINLTQNGNSASIAGAATAPAFNNKFTNLYSGENVVQ